MKILVTGGSGFIGTNIVEYFRHKYEVLSVDINAPKLESHRHLWKDVDILEKEPLENVFLNFQPQWVIHLAAKTDLNGREIESYAVNYEGTENVINAIKKCGTVQKALFFSSMYVCSPGYIPTDDDDFNPHTLYGESKRLMEVKIRETQHSYDWAIIRPTSIWGPFFSEPYANFFKIVIQGRYFHLGEKACVKTYGYIGNALYQIEALINSSLEGRMFYLGDYEPYPIDEWADEIADVLGKRIQTFPFFLFRIAGWGGDLLKMIGIRFPMTSFRLKNMTTDNILDISPLKRIAPHLPYTRKEGVTKTINWIRKG